MIKFILFFFLFTSLFANNLKIASYNVENFFDLNYNNTKYKEYLPNTNSLWNQKNFNIKLNNIIKVIKDLDADIIALQEIENKELIKLLIQKLPEYKYFSFSKYENSAVGLGILSKIEIKNSSNIDVKFLNKTFRPILETTFIYENVEFKIFNNHWPSKKSLEKYRIKYAKTLYDRLKNLPKDYDYIILGDFNSNYNEFEFLKINKELNTTSGITGINNILKTTKDNYFFNYEDMITNKDIIHYNAWLDLKINERFSYKFKNQNSTLDNMILSKSLFDNKNLIYVKKSFNVFKPDYLYKDGKINKWKTAKSKGNIIHKGQGYSDHLPIFAYFSTNNNFEKSKNFENKNANTINYLYEIEKLNNSILLNDIIVIYKENEKAIIKKQNDKAIYIHNNAQDLKLGYSYNIKVNKVNNFFGSKEIKDFTIVKENKKFEHYKDLFIDGSKINLFDSKYENEVIFNLKGKIKNKRLYFNDKEYIKIYSKNKDILPKNGETIELKNAKLNFYNGNAQIVFNKITDYKVVR